MSGSWVPAGSFLGNVRSQDRTERPQHSREEEGLKVRAHSSFCKELSGSHLGAYLAARSRGKIASFCLDWLLICSPAGLTSESGVWDSLVYLERL